MNYKIEKKENNLIEKETFKNLISINITNENYMHYEEDNSFIIFQSIDDILTLIYSNKKMSIISFNLIDSKKIIEIKKAHKLNISNFRHYLDEKNKRDLIISISGGDNNIKLWDINKVLCLFNFANINQNGRLYSACFLNDDNHNYIVTSNSHLFGTELIKVFDFNGNKIKEINDSNINVFTIDTFYDKKLSTNFILASNIGYIYTFDYNKNKYYNKFCDDYLNIFIFYIIFIDNDEKIKLISSTVYGNVKIWDFHSGQLLKKIKVIKGCLRGICLWNNDYLYVGCQDTTIKLINLNNGKIIQNLEGHFKEVSSIKKIFHPKLGECLISQGIGGDYLKLWYAK